MALSTLFLVRSNLEQHPGGDTTQIHQTAQALGRRGVHVRMSSAARPDFSGVDVVHLFHLDRLWENLPWLEQARRERIATVLSPIYWPSDEYDRHGRMGLQGLMSRIGGREPYQNARILRRSAIPIIARRSLPSLNQDTFSFQKSARTLLRTADAILPNSLAEQSQLERYFGIHAGFVVVPNAVDPDVFARADQTRPPKSRRGQAEAEVLCVGRIEPRKNQLTLIRAVEGTGMRLLIVGRAGRFSQRYARLCQKAAGRSVRFVDWQPPQQLSALYRAAPLHASVSWYETPGLASLEAALSGCRIVVTDRGCTREYFGDEASYCSPRDEDSIRDALHQSLAQPPRPELQTRIRSYTWDQTAEHTLAGYNAALKRAHPVIDGPRAPSVGAL